MKNVKSLKELQTKSPKGIEIAVLLKHSLFSRKKITWVPSKKHFKILNFIDDSVQTLTKGQIMDGDYTNIGQALTLNNLYYL